VYKRQHMASALEPDLYVEGNPTGLITHIISCTQINLGVSNEFGIATELLLVHETPLFLHPNAW